MIKLTQWDFTADLRQILASVNDDAGPRSMSSMVDAAGALVRQTREEDPAGLERWLSDNAEVLVGQQLLVASVHAQSSPAADLPRVLREWAAGADERTPAAAVAWLKEQYPALLRAWLLCKVEDLVADELSRF